jgi:hypothetical protein
MRRTSNARRRTFARPALAVAAALLISAVASASPAASSLRARAVTTSPPSYSVGIVRCTFVDRTRLTVNYSTSPPSVLANRRVLVTEIRYPTTAPASGAIESPGAAPAQVLGGFPTIVFAHGYDVTPDTYAALLDFWTRSGFVVAAPFFPEENHNAVVALNNAATEYNLWNEPADLVFVTRQLLEATTALTARCPLVHGLVLASALALAGHSDGGTVVGMLAGARGTDPQGTTYAELRAGLDFRAAIVMSAQEDGVSSYRSTSSDPALLVVQSAADRCNRASGSLRLYRDVHRGDKWFLELMRAHHLPPFTGEDPAAFTVVAGVTTRFLQVAFATASTASGIAAFGNARPGVARTYHAGRGPSIAPLTTAALCGLH